jgi:hypothetical protein
MITDYAANRILSAMFGKTSSAQIGSTCYLGLSSTQPNKSGGNVTEPSGNGYARVLVGIAGQSATQMMGNPSESKITNDKEIHFNAATGSWGILTYAVVYDAATGGTLLASGRILNSGGAETSITPTANSVVVLKVGSLDFSIT